MSYEPTPIEQWGSDHWSTLAYVETRIVDHQGRLMFYHLRGQMERPVSNPDRYPTRLRDGQERTRHNDFDCIADMLIEGFLAVEGDEVLANPPYEDRVFRRMYRLLPVLTFKITPLGKYVSDTLRTHKGNGGRWSNFDLPSDWREKAVAAPRVSS